MKRKIPLSRDQFESYSIKIQKVWRGFLVRENLKLVKSKKSTLQLKQIKSINNKPCFISVSTKSGRYILKIYEIFNYFEFTLILPVLDKYSAAYLIDKLDYHPLKLYYINDTNLRSNIWEIVTRTMKRINNKVYIFHFFRKFDSNKLKVDYFEISDEKVQSTFIYSDLNLENQSMQFIKRTIERRILPKLAIKNNNLEVINRGESLSFDTQFENSLLKIRRLVMNIQVARRKMTEFSIKISDRDESINPLLRDSYESFSIHTENQLNGQVPSMVKVQITKENGRIVQPLISKNLTKYINPEKKAALIIQKFFRKYLAVERYQLKRLQNFRVSNMKLTGRGGKIINSVPYYVQIFRGKNNFFIKVKNLTSGAFYHTEILPENYIFGYFQKQSARLICRSLRVHEGSPVFKYKIRKGNTVNLKQTGYVMFKKLSEAISLHQATARIQSIYKTLKLRSLFKASPNRNIFHSSLVVKNTTYHVAITQKRGYVLIELYLLKKQKNGHWKITKRIDNSEIIQKYGEINPGVLLKDIKIKHSQIEFGKKVIETNFQLQKHSSYITHEILTEEKFLKKSFKNFFVIETFYRSYKNTFLGNSYGVISFECYLPKDLENVRQISIHLSNASEVLGIPMIWVHPIAYFIQKRCLIISANKIGLSLKNKKIDLNQMAEKIQTYYKRYIKNKVLRNKTTKKKMTLRYRLSLLVKK